MTVVFVLKGYPRLSETFIAQEILGLERRGLKIAIASLRHPHDEGRHPIHGEIAAPVLYLPEYLRAESGRVVAGWCAARRMRGYGAAHQRFRRDLRRDPSRNRLRRFGQACVLAAELPAEATRLHAHFLHTPASVARYAAIMRGLPLSLSAHAKDVWTTPGWELAEKMTDAEWTTVCNAAAKDRLASLAPRNRGPALLYHGLDLARFPAFDRPATESPGADRFGSEAEAPIRFLSVGRAVQKKGFADLLAALAALPAGRSWRLTHIGGGADLPSLQMQAAALGLAGRIDWRGPRNQSEVLAALREADLFVLPSRLAADGDRDGLPNVLMEAQSQGLPVVSTWVSGIPELIRDGETGLLVPPADPAALAAALERLAADAALRDRLGRAALARLRAEFDADRWLDRLAARFDPALQMQAAAVSAA